MGQNKRWEDFPREDLKKIPYYRILGWIPQFHEKDIRAGRTTPDKVPHEAVSYAKKNTRIWLAGKVIQNTTVMVWMAADLVDGYWKNHRQYGTLDKAIEIENSAMDKSWVEQQQEKAIVNHQKDLNNVIETSLFGKGSENVSQIGTLNDAEFDELSNTFVSKPIIDVLRPHNCGGGVEYGKCDVCGNETYLQRKYWHYPIKCECCGPTHFEMVRHCKDCVPKEPLNTVVSTMDLHGIGKRKITIPTCILITEDR